VIIKKRGDLSIQMKNCFRDLEIGKKKNQGGLEKDLLTPNGGIHYLAPGGGFAGFLTQKG